MWVGQKRSFDFKMNIFGFLYAPMFTAALFRIVKVLKQLKCPSTDKWVKKMC